MAKVDTSTISGYEEMTPEQKIAALEGYEYEDHAAELQKAQNAISKANSEAAEYKRKLTSMLSDEEQKKQSADEEKAALVAKVAELEKAAKVESFKSRLIEDGYAAELALDSAKAMVEGDFDKVFANQKKFLESHDKDYKSKLMTGSDLTPAAGAPVGDSAKLEKLLADAMEKNDMSAATYYTRLIQQNKSNK